MYSKSLLNSINSNNDYPDEIWLEAPDKDTEKLQFIHTQLCDIIGDEEKRLHSIIGRAKFFLGAVLTSFALLLSILGEQISSFESWVASQQIWICSVTILFLVSVFFYLRIYYQTDKIESSIGTPLKESDSFLIIKNQLKIEELIHFSNFRYYKQIVRVKMERKDIEKLFKFGDGPFFIGILLCLFYAIVTVPFSPVTVVFFVISFVMGYYILVIRLLAKELSTLKKKWRKKE